MPPLQHSSTFDLAAAIPFADQSPSPFDKMFDGADITAAPTHHQHHSIEPPQQPQQQQQHQYEYTSHVDAAPLPSEADISALFGLPAAPAQAQAPIAQRPSPPPLPAVSTPAPVAPSAHYSLQQQHHHHLSHEKSAIAPIPASFAFPQAPSSASLSNPFVNTENTSMASRGTSAFHLNAPAFDASVAVVTEAPKKMAHYRYPSYNQTPATYSAEPQSQPQEHHHYQQQQQQQQQREHQHTHNQQQYNPNQYNVNGYSVISSDYSSQYGQTESATMQQNQTAAADPLMLNAPSRSIFSRFNSGGGGGLSTEGHGTFAPKLAKVAASYVSSTLAVTSTFASEKLATASTKIADLWQHNNQVLPQQQHYGQQHQQDGQGNLYNHGNNYSTVDASAHAYMTINSGGNSDTYSSNYNNGSTGGNVDPTAYSYDGQQGGALSANHNNNYHYQSSSYNNNNNNIDINNYNTSGNTNSNSSNATRNPFAATATSTLSNAASVAGSYLPSLSKLPALPALPTLPALPALPALPWGSKDKNQQLPSQQPSYQQNGQQQQQQQYASEGYYSSYEPSQGQAYQAPDQQQQPSVYVGQHNNGALGNGYSNAGGLLAGTGAWWGGLRNEMQKGRRMVETGVQVGVAWWWDSDTKNSLRNVV